MGISRLGASHCIQGWAEGCLWARGSCGLAEPQLPPRRAAVGFHGPPAATVSLQPPQQQGHSMGAEDLSVRGWLFQLPCMSPIPCPACPRVGTAAWGASIPCVQGPPAVSAATQLSFQPVAEMIRSRGSHLCRCPGDARGACIAPSPCASDGWKYGRRVCNGWVCNG